MVTSLIFALLSLPALVSSDNSNLIDFINQQYTGLQSIRVNGTLRCGSVPAANVLVKLVDVDFAFDPDDEMDACYTDENGKFEVSGSSQEVTTIDPHLKIYHDCNDAVNPCQRRWKFELPNKYITSGRFPKKTLDIGVWNLEAKMPDEEHDCLH
uniref:Uncharacterized protein n=1 Tax=Plectus sambesii TaxID=2011161 RepID=A0A914WKQ2_9BILA